MEALTALVFATGVATAFLFLPVEQAETALIGDIGRTGAADTAVSVGVCAALMAAVIVCLSEAGARQHLGGTGGRGRRSVPDATTCSICFAIAVIVALGVKMVGGLLTAALVAVPPLAARNLGRSLSQYSLGAAVIGTVSAAAGIVLFEVTGLPAGPMVILVSAAIFALTLPLAA